MTIPLALVVARARNGVIGADGAIPWRLKSDLALFKANTLGKPVIMGRKTWDSLPFKPLPGRMNIVLTRDGSFESRFALAYENFSEAVETAREQAEEDGVSEVCIIGGASLYEMALGRAKRLYLTEVDAEPDGDTLFPAFDEAAWTEVRREAFPAGEKDDHAFTFRVLERR
ncbi:MAG: dihydrofolate reductase [Caulobacter sp.]|nr:dihydrofolate reductase [Caulobacter sp.]